MRTSELQEMIVSTLVRKRGGTRRRWRIALGPIRVYDRATHPHCNWSVSPSGNASDIEAIEALLDEVRLDHPIVTKG